jgi:hypothetical protein
VSFDEVRSLNDDEPFSLRLAQTIAWCTPRAQASDPASSLRSDSLRPSVLVSDRANAVRQILSCRAAWDPDVRAAAPVRTRDDVGGGRLLLYFPDATLADGAAEAETGGFFDVENVPPWDTWIALLRDDSAGISCTDYLVSWVPGPLVTSVQRGIDVNPEECILWLADARVPLADALRSRGLLS